MNHPSSTTMSDHQLHLMNSNATTTNDIDRNANPMAQFLRHQQLQQLQAQQQQQHNQSLILQQQQQQQQPNQQCGNNNNDNNNQVFTNLMMSYGVLDGGQQQQPHVPQQQMQQESLDNELKRMQQLQSFNNNNHALLSNLQGRTDNNASGGGLFQSMMMMDQQKVQSQCFENPLNFGFFPDAHRHTQAMPFATPQQLQQSQQVQAVAPMTMMQPLASPHSLFHRDGSRRMRGGVIEPFPEKLHRLLLEVEAAGRGDVIGFVAGGCAFCIHKPDAFFKEIVPLYFRQSRLSSFKRQLNLYGFELINSGPARGGYFHELFVQDHPDKTSTTTAVVEKLPVVKVEPQPSHERTGTTNLEPALRSGVL
jgi:hypothetical protein